MTLAALRYFCEVEKAGSIREASERLNVAPSAVSRQIQIIEASLGLSLFERHPRGMRLTEAGVIYARYARQVLLDTGRVQSDIKELKGLRRGTVRIHAVEGILSSLLMPAIVAFRKLYPGVQFQLLITGSELVEIALRDNATDIGLTFNTQAPHPEITCVARWRDELVLAVHPNHPLAGLSTLTLDDLADLPLALPDQTFGIRGLLDRQCRRRRITLAPVLVVNSIETLRSFALSGGGPAVLSAKAVSRAVSKGELVAIPFKDEPTLSDTSVNVCVAAQRRVPPATAEFIHTLVCQTPASWPEESEAPSSPAGQSR